MNKKKLSKTSSSAKQRFKHAKKNDPARYWKIAFIWLAIFSALIILVVILGCLPFPSHVFMNITTKSMSFAVLKNDNLGGPVELDFDNSVKSIGFSGCEICYHEAVNKNALVTRIQESKQTIFISGKNGLILRKVSISESSEITMRLLDDNLIMLAIHATSSPGVPSGSIIGTVDTNGEFFREDNNTTVRLNQYKKLLSFTNTDERIVLLLQLPPMGQNKKTICLQDLPVNKVSFTIMNEKEQLEPYNYISGIESGAIDIGCNSLEGKIFPIKRSELSEFDYIVINAGDRYKLIRLEIGAKSFQSALYCDQSHGIDTGKQLDFARSISPSFLDFFISEPILIKIGIVLSSFVGLIFTFIKLIEIKKPPSS